MKKTVRTTCPYCGVGCGVLATPGEGFALEVKGDPDHPANRGRLCSKGSALGETVDLSGRLLSPEIAGKSASWGEALDAVAHGLQSVINQHGPDAVAIYASGQLLTEDYYVANKLMKGFIGTANIDTNSRLCMSSSVAGHTRAFGSDTVPTCYEDLEQAELIVLVGSNMAWCHPVLFQRLRAVKEQYPERRIIVIDPRRTQTCDIADQHLSLRPDSDVLLFNGLLHYLFRHGEVDFSFLESFTEGYSAALATAGQVASSIPSVALGCGLSEEDVTAFYRSFAGTRKVVTVYSQGINQSSSGTDKVNSIINCHLATGRIGQPGMGPMSLTGQPNAMGGREVGGLANLLAAHINFDEQGLDCVGRFWQAPNMAVKPGLKAVDMFRAVEQGTIKAIWIIATNPVVSLPDADRVRRALQTCDLVIVSDVMRQTDTTIHADILLPALAWAEKEGTVTNSERCISRQRPVLPAPGEARADWWIISQVASRLGFHEAFNYQHPAEIFQEHAALSAFENQGSRDFDLGGLAGLSRRQYDSLGPVQWPVYSGQTEGTARMFVDGGFFTPTRRARFIAVDPRAPANATDNEFPMVLNTGRVRDHWHTLTRTGKSQRLSGHVSEPYAELSPRDAARFRVHDGKLVRLRSRWGSMVARVRISEDQQDGSVFVPIHWNDQFSAQGRVDALVNPVVDPISGQPAFKYTPVAILPYESQWQGLLMLNQDARLNGIDYWVQARRQECWSYELAGTEMPDDWNVWLGTQVDLSSARKSEWIQYRDPASGVFRTALLDEGRLIASLYISSSHPLPERDWLIPMFAKKVLDASDRMALMLGRPAQAGKGCGRVICSCFNVGEETILQAIRDKGLNTTLAIGQSLKAGTNCGSCLPELKSLLKKAG